MTPAAPVDTGEVEDCANSEDHCIGTDEKPVSPFKSLFQVFVSVVTMRPLVANMYGGNDECNDSIKEEIE